MIRAGIHTNIAAILFLLELNTVALQQMGMFSESMIDVGATCVGISLIWWSLELTG